MTRVVFAIPGDIRVRTGGYEYDRRLIEALGEQGIEVDYCPLPESFPAPSAEDVASSVDAIARRRRDGDVILIDGLAYGVLPEAAVLAIGPRIVTLCHHPLALETGLSPERAESLFESERRALALASHVIVTSAHTRALLAREFGVDHAKIAVAPPGVDSAPRAQGSGGATTLLAVGAIVPRKAFDVLVEALSGLVDLDWRLRIVGNDSRDPLTTGALKGLIAAKSLESRIEILGEVASEDLASIFDRADLFVSASYYEGYGMSLTEAMTRGLAIVSSTGGAAAETVPDGAGLKVAPGGVVDLQRALRNAIADPDLRFELSEAAWRAGRELPRWEQTARIVAGVVAEMGAKGE
ncbi:glycosyltransferase family 4 protein [Methylocystis heyeri]|uniref:Glycosyltransferase n=1 Tax=Methylocystis heyeri TaxID=391905 RepID=A0A6B8KFC8_9HYPH|nr:glycosyltransferase family 4 protein [Methylocystis heyeri]QGM46407.1 glycosyltransferase [Methylocystis heyeri]